MKIMNQIMLMMIMMLSVVGIEAKIASKKHPADKQQIHFYNKYGSDIVVQATWRKRNGLASPGVPKNKEAHPTRITDFTVKKGKSIMVKAPISGYDLLEIFAQNAGQVAEEVGLAIGAAVITVASLGAADPAIGAGMAAGAAEAEEGGSALLITAGGVLGGAGVAMCAAAGYTIIAETAKDIAIRTDRARADDFTYFTFMPGKGKKVDKKNPPVMIVCAKMAPNKITDPAISITSVDSEQPVDQAKIASKKHPADKQQIHFYNKYGSDIVVQATWRKRNGLASPGVPKNKEAHPTRITDFTVKKGESMMVKAPISGYNLLEISAQNAGQVAEEVGMAVGAVGVGVATAGAGFVGGVIAATEEASDLAITSGIAVGVAVVGSAGYTGIAQGAKDVQVHQGKAQADDFTFFSFVPAKGNKVDKKNPPVMIVCAKMAPNKK